MQFGGRSRRNTSDAMHILVHRIKNAWRSGKGASVLFRNVQGAFPNTVKDQLLHNMKSRRIPTRYVQLADLMLTGRSTQNLTTLFQTRSTSTTAQHRALPFL